MSMVLRLESSCVNLTVIVNDDALVIKEGVMNESSEIRGSGATFWYQDRIWIGCHVPTPG